MVVNMVQKVINRQKMLVKNMGMEPEEFQKCKNPKV
jgi:hypothetical protein